MADELLYLPKTYMFERKNKAYADVANATRLGGTLDYVYLPKGNNLVQVNATGFGSGLAKVALYGAGGYYAFLTDPITLSVSDRLWTGQISSPGDQSSGRWIKIQLWNITTAGMDNGSISVQVTNFPSED